MSPSGSFLYNLGDWGLLQVASYKLQGIGVSFRLVSGDWCLLQVGACKLKGICISFKLVPVNIRGLASPSCWCL